MFRREKNTGAFSRVWHMEKPGTSSRSKDVSPTDILLNGGKKNTNKKLLKGDYLISYV